MNAAQVRCGDQFDDAVRTHLMKVIEIALPSFKHYSSGDTLLTVFVLANRETLRRGGPVQDRWSSFVDLIDERLPLLKFSCCKECQTILARFQGSAHDTLERIWTSSRHLHSEPSAERRAETPQTSPFSEVLDRDLSSSTETRGCACIRVSHR